MAKQVVNNGDTGLNARTKINSNFTELYDAVADLEAGGPGGGGSWGSITGTLSAQTDLANALAAKASLAGPQFTGSWSLSSGYGEGGIRPYSDSLAGDAGIGFYNFFGALLGKIVANNGGGFSIASGSNSLSIGASHLYYKAFYASDENGGGPFLPLFALDVTNGNEGGFYRSGTDQVWGAGRAARVSLSRAGVFNILFGTRLRITGIPTSASGLSSGDVWSDAGTLKIVA